MITISFEAFEAKFADLGKAVKQSPAIFYIKAGKAGKVELNKKSQTFTVGSGSGKNLEAITTACMEAGFGLVKQNKGWSVFAAKDIEDFQKIFGVVTTACMGSAKTVKLSTLVKKVNKEYVEKKTLEATKDAGLIKAKNLETIKSVAAKRAAALVA